MHELTQWHLNIAADPYEDKTIALVVPVLHLSEILDQGWNQAKIGGTDEQLKEEDWYPGCF